MQVGRLRERSRLKMMEELRIFITVDSHEAVKIGRLGEDCGIDTGDATLRREAGGMLRDGRWVQALLIMQAG